MRFPYVSSLTDMAKAVLAVMIGVLLTIVILVSLSSSPGHSDLFARQEILEQRLAFVACLILTPPENRTPETISECQAAPIDNAP
jgi:hypothetical protein